MGRVPMVEVGCITSIEEMAVVAPFGRRWNVLHSVLGNLEMIPRAIYTEWLCTMEYFLNQP